MKSKVVIKECLTYDLDKLEDVLGESLELLGGREAFFKPGQSVLIKPNLLTDAKPEEGITTHPNFVQAAVRVFKKAGLKLAIADIPGASKFELNLERVYKATGMLDLARSENVRLLTGSKFIEEEGVVFSNWVREFDHIVSLPKFKTHSLTTLTGAVKNVFGLTPHLYRVGLHKNFIRRDDFAKVVLNIYKKCRPILSFVDGIVALEGNGPGHGVIKKNLGLVAVSSDALALDSLLTYIMGLRPEVVATNREGRLQGLGETDLDKIEVLGDSLLGFRSSNFRLPPSYLTANLPRPVLNFLGRFAEFRPRVDKAQCNGCRICIENCPLQAIDLSDKKAKIDYKKCVDCFCCF